MLQIINNHYFCGTISKYTVLNSNKKTNKEQIVEKLSTLWNILTSEQRNFLYDQLTYKYFKKNEIIYREGDSAQYLMCILSGSAKIYKIGNSTRSQIMRVVQPIQYFGYRAYFAHQNYVTSACPFEPALICFIPMKCIEKITQENNQLAMLFVKLLSIDLGFSDQRSVFLTQSHIRGRLAETLLFLLENYGVETDGSTLCTSFAREDLAALSNMTTANAIRTLSNFVAEHLISLDGRHIRILNEEYLRRIAKIG